MYGIFPGRLLTVAPDPATGQDFGESGAVTTGGYIEHGAHRVGLDLVSAQAGGNPSGGKESERDQGHQPVMVVIAGGRGWDPLLLRAGHCSGLASFLGVMDPSATHARILLVRHGESTWNAAARWQGRADPPLTDVGQRQAAAAAEAIGAVDAIVSSTLQRAHHTAVILSEFLGIGPVHLDERLMERDAGEWTGLTMEEIDVRYPGARKAWLTPPGFESDEAVIERVLVALRDIAEEFAGGEVVAVTHGGVIFALARHLNDHSGRIPNLGAQWVDVGFNGEFRLGDRVPLLAEHNAAPITADATEQV